MHDLISFPYSYDIPILLEYEKGIRNFQTFLLNFSEISYILKSPLEPLEYITFGCNVSWRIFNHGKFMN